MATRANSTPAPSIQDAALERLFDKYELIHARPLALGDRQPRPSRLCLAIP